MSKINYRRLKDVIESASVEKEDYSVKLSMYPITSKSVYVENRSNLVKIKANVAVNIKRTGENLLFPVDLLKVYHYGDTGFVINGKNRQVVDLYTKSFGWYIGEGKSGEIKRPNARLISDYGRNITIYENDKVLYVTLEKKIGKRGAGVNAVPLSVFLKAFTGESFMDIASKLGLNSMYVMSTFGMEEPSRPECVDKTILALFAEFRQAKNLHAFENMSPNDRFKYLYDRLFSPVAMILGDIVGVRMKRALTFKERCKNLTLGEDLEVNGRLIEKGITLDVRTLEEIDYLPINSIKVYDSNGKVHTPRKISVYNFRALGGVLEEEVHIGKEVIPAGTVLDVPLLKRIEETNRESLKVKMNGMSTTVHRKLFSGILSVDDILSMVDVFIGALNGLESYDNIYGLTNQNLVSIEAKAGMYLSSYCRALVSYIEEYAISPKEGEDLVRRVISLPGFNTTALINEVNSKENRETQSAELNNTIQKISKEHRVSKRVNRSSPDMVSVQGDQIGLLDPIDSPESDKIGIVHTKTFLSKTDENGFLAAPYTRVKDGKVIGNEPVYLTASERKDQYIAEWNETFHELDKDGNMVLKDKIKVLCNDTIMHVPVKDVMYKQWGPIQTMSPARMQIPFQEHSNPKRILMGCNQQKQTVVPLNSERPIVSSGGDSLLGEGIITAFEILEEFYEANEEALEGVSKDDFMQCELTLKSAQIQNGYKELIFELDKYPLYNPTVVIPFIQKSTSGSLFSYQVNSLNGIKYKGKDIVAHSIDMDIRKYDILKHTDYGEMDIPEEVFERALAIAKNLVVVYKTYESSTIDDAITINADLVGMDTLTTIDLVKKEKKLSDVINDPGNGLTIHEEFGFESKPTARHMDVDGLPKLGSILRPGDTVIATKKIEKSFTKSRSGTKVSTMVKNVEMSLGSTEEGQVVYRNIEGREATVLLARLAPIEVGDKMAGRYGNKGVIARIIPREMMPYDPKTGLIPDMILNPLGVPSRSNLSQILEVVLGFAMKKMGKIAIVSPYKGDSLEFVREMADRADIKPMMLVDGRTGRYFERPMNVGVMYMLKLEHMVSHKIKSIGFSRHDQMFNQPNKGLDHAGGQSIGEYEFWSLMAAGAKKVAQDLFSLQSDDLIAIESLKETLKENPLEVEIEGNNNNDHLFQVIHRSCCVEPTVDIEGNFSFSPMTDAMIRGLSSIPVDIKNKESLRSTHIFGGTVNNRMRIEARTLWSWFPLHCEMIHPFWIIKGKISRFIVINKETIDDQGEIRVERDFMKLKWVKDLMRGDLHLLISDGEDGKVYTLVPDPDEDTVTGIPALVKLFREYDLAETKAFCNGKISRAKKEDAALPYKQMLRTLEEYDRVGRKLSDFIISSLPVMPLVFRPTSPFKAKFQDFDFYYKKVIDAVNRHLDNDKRNISDIYSIFLRIVELTGLPFGDEIKKPSNNAVPILRYFTGKEGNRKEHGKIREALLKKRVICSGRTVIVPSSDVKRMPTQMGLPFMMCIKIWGPQLQSLLAKNFNEVNLSDSHWEEILVAMATNKAEFNNLTKTLRRVTELDEVALYDKLYAVISAYIEGRKDEDGNWTVTPRVFLAGRQPSLHKFNIRAYTPVITHNKCIEIPPLVAKGYNADFDGDQMWVAALVNESACEEALEKLSPKYGVINPKDSSIILKHDQDIVLGVYYATMLYNNVDSIEKDPRYNDIKFYSNLKLLDTDVDLGFIRLHDLVCFSHKGRKYLSTAGRILFNGLLPNGLGFTDEPFKNILGIKGIKEDGYNNLRFDGLVSGSGGSRKTPVYCPLSKVTMWSYENFDADTNLRVYQAISEFGLKYADRSGISFLLEDLVEYKEMPKYLAIAEEQAQVINRRYMEGMMSEEDRKESLIDLFNNLKDIIKSNFMSTFDRNNNIFIMFDSGARGNAEQIMQACGIIGILQKSKTETLEVPVLSNYMVGNTSFDTIALSYSTRTVVASTQNETSVSGELTRLAVYMLSGFTIVEEDCGVAPMPIDIKYSDKNMFMITPIGTRVDSSDIIAHLTGKKLRNLSEEQAKILKNFMKDDNELTESCVKLILKNHISDLEFDEGEYKIYYQLDPTYKSLLVRRTAEDLPHLLKDMVISNDTISYIEKENIKTARIRNMIKCRSIGGVCAKCYGWRYDANKYPEVGDFIGIESAQSVGEPSAQLTMSLFHQGGVAGAGIDQAVALAQSLLERGRGPDRMAGALAAPADGYVHITDELGPNRVRFTADGKDPVLLHTETPLIVENGEYVKLGQKLSEGFVVPKNIAEETNERIIYAKQMALLEFYVRLFEQLKINSRHFELIVRAQSSIVTIIKSDNEKFKEGLTYELNEVIGEEGVEYMFDISTQRETIAHFSGYPTLLSHSHLMDGLGDIASSMSKSKGKSPIGYVFYGRAVDGKLEKILTAPKPLEISSGVGNGSLKENRMTSFTVEELIKETTSQIEEIDIGMDLSDLLGTLKPTEEPEIIYTKVEAKEETTKVLEVTEAPKTTKMDLFSK